jgi:hypothetical protein
VSVSSLSSTGTVASVPATSPEGTAIRLTAAVSDPNTGDSGNSYSYAWTVTKNGTPFMTGNDPSGRFTFTPDDLGTYVITLAVTDSDGQTGFDRETLAVTDVLPTVTIAGLPQGGISVLRTTFTLTASAASVSPTDAAAGFGFNWFIEKDGVPFDEGSGAAMMLTPPAPGSYTVTLTATAQNGATSDPEQVSITVLPDATTTALTSSASTAVSGQSVTFTARVRINAPGSGAPTGSVSFYDGSSLLGRKDLQILNGVAQATLTSSALNVGNHTITAVYGGDANDSTSTAKSTLTINNPVPPPVRVPPPVSAVLIPRKVGKKKLLAVRIMQNGQTLRLIISPFQKPLYQAIQVLAVDTNGDGSPDTVKLFAKKGKKTVTWTFTV